MSVRKVGAVAIAGVVASLLVWLFVFPVLAYRPTVELGRSGVGVPFQTEVRLKNYGLRTIHVLGGKTVSVSAPAHREALDESEG